MNLLLTTLLLTPSLWANPHSTDFGRRNYHHEDNFVHNMTYHFKANETAKTPLPSARRNSFQKARKKRQERRAAERAQRKKATIPTR